MDDPYEDGIEDETEMVTLPPAPEPALFETPSRGDPPSSSGEIGLIEAARMQAQHRSRPAMRGVGMAASIPGYTIVRELHRGGQGVVYLARQEGTGRQVAIKLMREGALARQSDRLRFEREIQVLAQLNNPNIVTIHDSGVAGGCGYYVMDYIAGRTLDEYVRHAELGVEEILKLFIKVCHAVNAAHLRGVIHRDIKPSNIRVTPEGEPHVLDFGLAKLESVDGEASAAPTQMTATGQFVGSLPWASPEQARGEGAKIDVRTDVYSLGVILYELLTGRFPYKVNGPMAEVVDRIANEIPARPGTFSKPINSELDTIVLKALSKSRAQRYQTPGEFARDIERLLAGQPIEAKRDNWRYMSRKILQRYWASVAAAGVVLVALVVVLWGAFGGVREEGAAELRTENARLREELEAAQQENAALRDRVKELEGTGTD
ncbi:MAG: protein kinase [Phycisphaeraceae bacterium]|nr:MAG: protein kinase [Phycisphaeraceae bacterium]